MKDRIQSLLQQEQVQAPLHKASALAQRWKIHEKASKVPQLLEEWQVQERIGRVYHESIAPYVKRISGDKSQEIEAELDRIIAQGIELTTASNGREEETWKLDAIEWLGEGEALLRDNMPDEFRKLTAFAARLSPDMPRTRLEQVLAERLRMLTEIRRRRGVGSLRPEPGM